MPARLFLVAALCFTGVGEKISQDLSAILHGTRILELREQESEDEHLMPFGNAALAFIFLYRRYISSQDISACVFSPTCSEFGMRSINRYGIIRGLLMASDRLQRCHPMAIFYLDRQYTWSGTSPPRLTEMHGVGTW